MSRWGAGSVLLMLRATHLMTTLQGLIRKYLGLGWVLSGLLLPLLRHQLLWLNASQTSADTQLYCGVKSCIFSSFILIHTASYTSLMLAVKIENIVKMRGHNEFSHTGASKIYRRELVLPMHRQLVSVLQHFTSDGSSDSQAEMITYEHIHTTSTLTFVGRLLLCWSVRPRWWWSLVSNGNVTRAFTSSRPCPYAPQVLCYFDHSCFKTVQGLDISRETIVFHWVSCWNLSLLIRADRVTVWMLTLQRSEWYWAVSGVLTMGGVSCLDQPVLISHQVTQWCSHLLITALNQSTVRHTVTAQQCILPSQSTSTLIRPELTCLAKLGF